MTAEQKHTAIVEAETIELPTPTERSLAPLQFDVQTSQQMRDDLGNLLSDSVRGVF